MSDLTARLERMDPEERPVELNRVLLREQESDLFVVIQIAINEMRQQAIDSLRAIPRSDNDAWVQIGVLNAADLIERLMTPAEETDDE